MACIITRPVSVLTMIGLSDAALTGAGAAIVAVFTGSGLAAGTAAGLAGSGLATTAVLIGSAFTTGAVHVIDGGWIN